MAQIIIKAKKKNSKQESK